MKRLVEFCLLFVLLPLAMLAAPFRIPKIPLLLGAALGCGALLLRDPAFDRSRLRWAAPAQRFAKTLALRIALVSLVLAAAAGWFMPEAFLSFPRQRTGLWLLVMCLYPVLSAFPQELLYRAFFFHRYQALFSGERRMIWASTLSFAFLHIIFGNPVAPLLTVPGGYLFARTYARNGSLPAAIIEHAAYGNIVFTVGLGMYFYNG
jgi:membrane protease YdiL (CAAX protease family)